MYMHFIRAHSRQHILFTVWCSCIHTHVGHAQLQHGTCTILERAQQPFRARTAMRTEIAALAEMHLVGRHTACTTETQRKAIAPLHRRGAPPSATGPRQPPAPPWPLLTPRRK
mmetsp:Transcript_56260/g.147754  ORF Transcript_56260/g.147754 Transcript_56260/m.147754 type:complete len:113 (+) Transcript_56260:77-415(+)